MQIDKIAAQPRAIRHAFHSARSFDNEGLLVFNPDRYAVPSSIAFAEPEPTTLEPAPPEKTYSKAEFDSHMARARKSFEADAAKAAESATATLKAELEALKAAQDDAGKSAAEKAQAAAARERAVIEAKLAEREKALLERDSLISARTQELRDTRLDHELSGLLASAKVLPQAMRAASLVFKSDAKIEYDADGNVSGVDLGTGRYPTVAAALAEWMKTNGDIYVAAPAGGIGTKPGNAGGSSVPHMKKTTEQLIAEADALRSRARQ